MYSGNVARIYNPSPDPLECGPPKRVIREEQHIGEMVASSKKRITWRFTLGESDRTHEVVLVHSVMSYKKVVHYDGRQMHFSSTAMLGDWRFTMILDGLKLVMELRINEKESDDIPKYDFLIDKVPFRRWDVYRRKKHTIAYAQPNASSGNAYGTHRWGPNGAVPSSQTEYQRPHGLYNTREVANVSSSSPFKERSSAPDRKQSFGHQGARSRTSSGQGNGRARSFSGPQDGQQGFCGEHHEEQRASLQDQSIPLSSRSSTRNGDRRLPSASDMPKLKKQLEINLIDDSGPSVSVSAQSLLFDPLASAKLSSTTRDLAATSATQQQQSRPVATVSQYVDPFASVPTPVMAKPTGSVNFDPLSTASVCNYQQQQQTRQIPPSSISHATGYQQQPMTIAMGAPMVQQQVPRGSFTRQQATPMTDVNSISQLLNPASLQTSQLDQQRKSIDIDAFAGLGS